MRAPVLGKQRRGPILALSFPSVIYSIVQSKFLQLIIKRDTFEQKLAQVTNNASHTGAPLQRIETKFCFADPPKPDQQEACAIVCQKSSAPLCDLCHFPVKSLTI